MPLSQVISDRGVIDANNSSCTTTPFDKSMKVNCNQHSNVCPYRGQLEDSS